MICRPISLTASPCGAGGAVAIPLYIGSAGIASGQGDNLGRRADNVLRCELP